MESKDINTKMYLVCPNSVDNFIQIFISTIFLVIEDEKKCSLLSSMIRYGKSTLFIELICVLVFFGLFLFR